MSEENELLSVLASMGEGLEFLDKVAPLRQTDLTLVGSFVQEYCWADFNARRAISYLRKINGKGFENFAGRLNDTEVLRHLRRESEELKEFDVLRTRLPKIADVLEMHRGLRHELAHWAVKKVKDHEMLMLLTTNSLTATKKGLPSLESDHLAYGMVKIEDLRRGVQELNFQNEFLAQAVGFLGEHAKTVP